jgi:hypothetical protein
MVSSARGTSSAEENSGMSGDRILYAVDDIIHLLAAGFDSANCACLSACASV